MKIQKAADYFEFFNDFNDFYESKLITIHKKKQFIYKIKQKQIKNIYKIKIKIKTITYIK